MIFLCWCSKRESISLLDFCFYFGQGAKAHMEGVLCCQWYLVGLGLVGENGGERRGMKGYILEFGKSLSRAPGTENGDQLWFKETRPLKGYPQKKTSPNPGRLNWKRH